MTIDGFLDIINRELRKKVRRDKYSSLLTETGSVYNYIRDAFTRRYGRECKGNESWYGDKTIIFTGKAICDNQDIFDETAGEQIARDKARAKMESAMGRVLNDAFCVNTAMNSDILALANKHTAQADKLMKSAKN